MILFRSEKKQLSAEFGRIILLGLLLPVLISPANMSANGHLGFIQWRGYTDLLAGQPILQIVPVILLTIAICSVISDYKLRRHGLPMLAMVLCALYFVSSHFYVGWELIWCGMFTSMILDERGKKDAAFFLLALVLLQIIVGLIAYKVQFHQFITPGFGYRASGLYGSPITYSPICFMAVSLFLSVYLTSCGIEGRLLSAVSFILCLLMLIFTYTRSAWVGAASTFVMIQSHGSRRLQAILIIMAFSLIAGALLVRANGDIRAVAADKSANGRVIIWRYVIMDAGNHLWLGKGDGEEGKVMRKADQDLKNGGYGKRPGNPKNLYLYILLTYGLIGLFLHVALFTRSLFISYNIIRNQKTAYIDKVIARSCFCAISGLLTAGLFDTPILTYATFPSTAILFVLIGLVCRIDASISSYS